LVDIKLPTTIYKKQISQGKREHLKYKKITPILQQVTIVTPTLD